MDEQKPHSRASHDAVAGSDTSGLNPCNLATDLQSKEKCATEAIQVPAHLIPPFSVGLNTTKPKELSSTVKWVGGSSHCSGSLKIVGSYYHCCKQY